MVSKNQIKFITGLHQKKVRIAEQLFIAEGFKVIQELLQSDFELEHLYVTEAIFDDVDSAKKTLISSGELSKMSALTVPNNCLGVFKMKVSKPIVFQGLIVALDEVRDPGNLGTILRLCDWFGIEQLVCSEQTVDLYNPKVVQATMGSIARVQVHYLNLNDFIQKATIPVFGTFMDGVSIYKKEVPRDGVIIFGNEANGISPEIESTIKNRLSIPRFGKLRLTESLNVASATAIVLSEFCRKME